MRCIALEHQKKLRDLIQLPKLIEELSWIEVEQSSTAPDPLILCALWLWESPEQARIVLKQRSNAGLITLIVPRFKTGNLQQWFPVASAVEIRSGEFNQVDWKDGQIFQVPGVVYFDTALHQGRWGVALGKGTSIFCFRSHASAGPVIFCTAALTGRPLQVSLQEQKALFQKIWEESQKGVKAPPVEHGIDNTEAEEERSIEALLEKGGSDYAMLLLALIAAEGEGERDLITIAKEYRMQLNPVFIEKHMKHFPETPMADIKQLLKKKGWGAFLRRIEKQRQLLSGSV